MTQVLRKFLESILRASQLALRYLAFFLMLSALASPSEGLHSDGSVDYATVPTLTVVWNDAYRLGPWDLSVTRVELEQIFSASGVDLRLERGRRKTDEPDGLLVCVGPAVNVVLMPVRSEAWGLAPRVLGATVGRPAEKRTVFVFVPNVHRTLGIREAPDHPREQYEFARALGRIVAHELVHALAPEQPHTGRGVMQGRLTRPFLVQDELSLDSPTAAVLRSKLLLKRAAGLDVDDPVA